jgi:non-ribosomal peptide synthetase component F
MVDLAQFSAALRSLASAEQVSVKAVLHAVHQKVLSQLTAETRFHSGLVCDARPEAVGADRVQGMFLNTLPFAHDARARTWREQIRSVFDREVELWPHRRYPLPAIQRATGGRLIEVLFNYQDFRQDAAVAPSGLMVELSVGEGATEFALSVIGTVDGFELLTNTVAMDRQNLDRLAAMYLSVVQTMLADPDGDAQIVCLPAGERESLLSGQHTSAEPVTGRLHEVFEQRAAQFPNAPAVGYGPDSLTYAELNADANRLAARLISEGAGPDSIVGVCLGRGLALVPALLAVLKAGAGYLPLDPAQPSERLAYMLDDAGVTTVVTDGEHLELLAGYSGQKVRADDQTLSQLPDSNPISDGGPENLAYVI